MAGPILLCSDGSSLSLDALARGLELLGRDRPLLVVTVVDEPDPTLVTGTGFAGGVMTPEELEARTAAAATEAEKVLVATVEALGLAEADRRALHGDAGVAICSLADDVDAAAVVIGSRGHGGLRRAVLGSVSDHVVRHATCPVVVVGDHAVHDDAS